MGNQNSNYRDEYEEPVPEGYKFLNQDNLLRTGHLPKRIRKNPDVPPCKRGECKDAAQYLEFKEWMVKEWAVYVAEIDALRKKVAECWHTDGASIVRNERCVKLTQKYIMLVDDRQLRAARQQLWEGKKLIPDQKAAAQ